MLTMVTTFEHYQPVLTKSNAYQNTPFDSIDRYFIHSRPNLTVFGSDFTFNSQKILIEFKTKHLYHRFSGQFKELPNETLSK